MNTVKDNKQITLNSFARIRNFLPAEKTPEPFIAAIENIADYLLKKNILGQIQVNIIEKTKMPIVVLNLSSETKKISFQEIKAPKFNIIVKSEEILTAIFNGKISPVYAMAKGEMRVKGDIKFGIELYKTLAADKGIIDPCI